MVKTALGEKAGAAQNALMLSEQIGPILASGTKGNPRQIKRFLNMLLLRKASADARGFGDDVKLPVLAKLMLAERFLSRLFDQIATAAASSGDGTCTDLTALEAAISQPNRQAASATTDSGETKAGTRAKAPAKLEVVKPTESAVVTEWLSSEVIKSWARITPPIGEEDLRPYLFVTKDRKDYFGATSILGHLAGVAEKLLGPKLAVQAMEKDLAKLAQPEAAQVFEAVRGRIIGGDTFDKEPNGAAGLEVLVKAHPGLQGTLLNFLESLPHQRLGPWVCGGWDAVIKEPQMIERFERLLEAWSKDGGQMLKVAAGGTLRTRRQGALR